MGIICPHFRGGFIGVTTEKTVGISLVIAYIPKPAELPNLAAFVTPTAFYKKQGVNDIQNKSSAVKTFQAKVALAFQMYVCI